MESPFSAGLVHFDHQLRLLPGVSVGFAGTSGAWAPGVPVAAVDQSLVASRVGRPHLHLVGLAVGEAGDGGGEGGVRMVLKGSCGVQSASALLVVTAVLHVVVGDGGAVLGGLGPLRPPASAVARSQRRLCRDVRRLGCRVPVAAVSDQLAVASRAARPHLHIVGLAVGEAGDGGGEGQWRP